ncbi:acyltransferase [Streptomyces sp. NPDC001657]|uniref:acyltransferase family protein n=1 Tax=Streptomyces sp. NPDC001657 TaxID=3154522 RepID=UPI0033164D21
MTDDLARPALAVGPEPATGRPKAAARLLYIDNLRIVLTALVVLHHTAVTYGNIPAWYYTEPAKDGSGLLLDVFVMFNQAFFMGFFFMIAGFFTPASYERKGTRPFLRDRLKRLGIPLLAFLLLIRPLVGLGGFADLRAEFAEQGKDLPYWLYYVLSWDAGPMWFVEVLLAFSLVYALVRHRRARRLAGVGGETGTAGRAPERAPRPLRPLAIIVFTVGLALATYLWRIVVPNGSYLPVLGLPTPSFMPQYASFFVIGVLAHRRGWPQTLSRVAGRVGFVVATVATLGYLPVVLTAGDGALDGHGSWQSLAGAAWESTFAVGVVLGLTVLFRERFPRQGPFAAFLSRHAFAVYLTHAAVLVGLGYAFRWLHAPAAVKFALVAALALPLCWAVAYAVRSLPRADRVL